MALAWAVALVSALVATVASGGVQAAEWASDCKFEKTIELTLNLSGSEELSIAAKAGDLEVTGNADLSEARIVGKVCASNEEWLDETRVLTEGGRKASITVETPAMEDGWTLFNSRYVYVDLEIIVPTADVMDLALDIQDSSGDVTVRGTGPVNLRDSSGDITLEDVSGGVMLKDSSGDIDLRRVVGDVTVRQDSSGDIYGRDIRGSVLIEQDSSGDVRFEDVQGDYVVERDSSGDIEAKTVSGAFRVLSDGSGDVSYSDVSGEVEVPEDS
jgi:DUF4097 and DUF4098 domain-containing protein YvlB